MLYMPSTDEFLMCHMGHISSGSVFHMCHIHECRLCCNNMGVRHTMLDACGYVYTYFFLYAFMCACVCVYIYVLCICIYIHICVYLCMYIHVYVFVYTYI